MARTDDSTDQQERDEMLPDEREAVAERHDSLADGGRLSVEEVTEDLGIDLGE